MILLGAGSWELEAEEKWVSERKKSGGLLKQVR